jgi:hypothetical protein
MRIAERIRAAIARRLKVMRRMGLNSVDVTKASGSGSENEI